MSRSKHPRHPHTGRAACGVCTGLRSTRRRARLEEPVPTPREAESDRDHERTADAIAAWLESEADPC